MFPVNFKKIFKSTFYKKDLLATASGPSVFFTNYARITIVWKSVSIWYNLPTGTES